MPQKAIRIRVGSEIWEVPYGFGRWYSDIAGDILRGDYPDQSISDLLVLIGYEVDTNDVGKLTLRRKVDLAVYALTTHARASDNPIRVPPRPCGLPDPWCGPHHTPTSISLE